MVTKEEPAKQLKRLLLDLCDTCETYAPIVGKAAQKVSRVAATSEWEHIKGFIAANEVAYPCVTKGQHIARELRVPFMKELMSEARESPLFPDPLSEYILAGTNNCWGIVLIAVSVASTPDEIIDFCEHIDTLHSEGDVASAKNLLRLYLWHREDFLRINWGELRLRVEQECDLLTSACGRSESLPE
ncbi:hypothetical protein [Rubinisphaera brasiliensis]|uniref:Uncharacterized protein n=1 Tax=Rubinisphaera brasiliensis (strain ATCC 49424 / DSM 5305 / JCM 21570 / IAM 15109 / NBRC 103401 / IFAM 1448) TaxID=756272 RepID=F0SNL5_RUBBR|nr:hypothetical protein [Rubinisphaera brasiliensis]ADY57849.1 hypothetical protein Plabr_0220 [Rubinisphaera brasiliensis DSM 5305]